MTIGVHSFQIPHEFVAPTRDMAIIRIPFPPRKIGNIITPDITRDLMQHNVMAGRIVAKGPLAFSYKDSEGLHAQAAEIGDWVIIRPFAGTMIQGGKLAVNSGFRYVSTFQDVIGVIPADKMPDPASLDWDDSEEAAAPAAKAADDFSFSNAKETLTLRVDQIPSSNHTLSQSQLPNHNGPHGV